MPCKCPFCNSIISRTWDLKRHQQTNRCLKIQSDLNKLKINEIESKSIVSLTNNGNTNTNNGNNNTITNKIINITNILQFSPDFSRENIAKAVEKITSDVLKKETGLADIYIDNIAKNENGEYGIVNTNKKNPSFHFRKKDGSIGKDSSGEMITKRFTHMSKEKIDDSLKEVKKNVNEIDYAQIEENVKNPNRFIKNVSDGLHIDKVKSNNDNDELWDEKDEDPRILELEKEIKVMKSKKLKLDEIELDFDELNISEADIDSIIKEKQKIQYNFDREKEKNIKKIEKKIDILDPKWYTEKRQQNERKEKTKNKIISKKSNENAKIEYKDMDEGGILKYILEFE